MGYGPWAAVGGGASPAPAAVRLRGRAAGGRRPAPEAQGGNLTPAVTCIRPYEDCAGISVETDH